MPSLNTGNAILSNPIKVDSSYNVGIGGAASGSFKLQVTGTTNLTDALTGTSATFTGTSGAFIGLTINNTDATGSARLRVTSTGGNINDFSSFSASHPSRANQAWLGGDGSSTVTVLQAGGVEFLRGTSTGAATFSNNLEVFSGSAGVTVGDFLVNPTTKYVYVGRQSSTSGDNTIFVVRDRTGSARATIPGGGSIDTVFSTNNSNFIVSNYSGNSLMTIANTGAATFSSQVNAESFYTNDTRYIANQIMAGYNANSEDSDIWINYTGYQGGATRFRDFRIGNGKQGQIAFFDGSTSNVGIGTNSPGSILDVKGTGTYDFIKISNGSTSGGGGFLSYQNGIASSWFGNSGGWEGGTSNDTGIGSYAGGIRFYTNGGTEKMRITSGGAVQVGIGAAATNVNFNINGVANKAGRIQFMESGSPIWLAGNGAASENGRFEIYDNINGTGVQLLRGATSWTALSDERFKDIIEPISVNDKLKDIRAVIGKYKTDTDGIRRNFLIAQDLLKVFPEVVDVDEDKDKPMGVRYQDLIPVLVKAIQELNQTVQNQQQQINSLINR